MDPRYPPEAEAFRSEVRAFLGERLPADWPGTGALDRDAALAFTEQWRSTLYSWSSSAREPTSHARASRVRS
jgi:hypothetical protein